MSLKFALTGAVAAAALMVAACGSYSTSPYGSSTTPPSSYGRYPGAASSPPAGTPAPSAASVVLRSTPLGQILVDGSGRTLYLFAADKAGMSTCYGDCASVWPPLLASGTPVAGAGLDQMLLTTTARRDGSLEVVYNGHPLYHFVSDKQAGDTTGQAISSFGADWYALSAAGNRVGNS